MSADTDNATRDAKPGYASLCFLSYARGSFIEESIRSAIERAGYPCEVIVHDDGSQEEVRNRLNRMQREGLISSLILNPQGHNEGVGRAINRTFALATGDPVIKLDQDLLFEPNWLRRSVDILRADPYIGMLGLFRYWHDPVDHPKMVLPSPEGARYQYVRDFVGSALVTPRNTLDIFGAFPEHSDAFAEDVEYKTRIRAAGLELALPADEDFATNRGFGYGPSTVCVAPGKVQEIHHRPLVFGG